MQLVKLFLATTLATMIGTVGASAQDAEHHPAVTTEAPAPPAPPAAKPGQGAMTSANKPGMAMGQGAGMMQPGPGVPGGTDMAMMRECMGMMGSMMRSQGDIAADAPDDPVDGAFAAINRRMHRDMMVPAGGNPDTAFAQAMIAHHQGAIDMARVILGFGSDPEIRKLAQEVITAQQGEIAFLQQWLVRQPKP
jgi:uncharacterized protein (DUF305 family)